MTFAIDRTRSYLKIEASVLLSLHRSTHPIVPAADYCQGHLCEAFICVVLEYNLHRVYLALHDQQLKSNLVFVADPFRPDTKKMEALLLEAHGFLENIGFKMEEVNINFSSATLEVIIKDIRVMREPSLALQLDAAKMALEVQNTEKREIVQKASRELLKLKAEIEDLRGQLTAATAVQQAPIVEPSIKAENGGGSALQAETDALRKESGVLREQGEGVRLRLVGAEKELQKTLEELSGVKALLKSAREGMKSAKDEAKHARKEQKLSKHESESLNEKLKSEQLEHDKARKEIEVISRELQDVRKAYEAALNTRVTINDDIEAVHQAATGDLKAEIDRLTAELSGNNIAYAAEIEVLKAALANANMSLSAEKAKNESALLEMDALDRDASVELKLLKKKVDSLSAEKQLLEKISADIKNKAYGEIERQQQVIQSQRKAAIKKLNALKEEIRRLSEARAVITSPTGLPLVKSGNGISYLQADGRTETSAVTQQTSFSSDPFRSSEATSGNKLSSPPANDRKELSIDGQQAGFAPDPFRTCEATENINFLPDKSLKGIPYSLSTDVVEIYRSYNTIHAAPTGKQAQRCDGFVCIVNEGDQSLVYVAWLMNTSGEVLICLPECVADGEVSCQQILREGIGYFERIGFVIDRLNLAQDPDKRQIQLDNLAVFCRTVTNCDVLNSAL